MKLEDFEAALSLADELAKTTPEITVAREFRSLTGYGIRDIQYYLPRWKKIYEERASVRG